MTNISISGMIKDMSYENKNILSYKDLNRKNEKNEKKSSLTSTVKALALLGLATAGIAVSVYSEKPTQFSEATIPHVVEQGEGINASAFDTNRTDPNIQYIEVVEHIKQMPENEKVLSDGLQAGEIITVPETASK